MKQDLLWDAAMQAIYGESKPSLTTSERGRLNSALKQLRDIGATPEEFTARWKQYPRVMPPGTIITITGFVAHWSRCIPIKPKPTHASHTEWGGI